MKQMGWIAVGLTYLLIVWCSTADHIDFTGSAWGNATLLIVATLAWSSLIKYAMVLTWPKTVLSNIDPKTRRLARVGLISLLVQFILGALVRYTHSGLSCPNFPNCLNGFLPDPWSFETSLSFLHRWLGVLMLGLFIHLSVRILRVAPKLAIAGGNILGLASAQVFLGIGLVLSGLNSHSRLSHAAVGYALWGVLFYIGLRSGGVKWDWISSRK